MCDTPIDEKIKTGLKTQAKIIAHVILYTQADIDKPPISDATVKKTADAVYTTLYSLHYQEKDNSAYEFLKFHSKELQYCEWEPELVQGVGE